MSRRQILLEHKTATKNTVQETLPTFVTRGSRMPKFARTICDFLKRRWNLSQIFSYDHVSWLQKVLHGW